MKPDRYIAAIEISSSRITAAVGRTREGGILEIIAIDSEKTEESVRYGVIQNLEEAATRTRHLIDRLQRKPEVSPRRISGLYVGLSGRSVRSVTAEASIRLPEESEITEDVLDRLRDKALQTSVGGRLEVIDAVPRTFRIGNLETLSPKGSIGQEISATYDLIVCRPELRRNITRTLPEKLGIQNEGFVITGIATGHILLKEEERRLGCMLVDFGAETTTVSIYKFGHLLFFATLPLGGRNITRDLTSLNMLEENAEQIKRTSGNALASETQANINLNGLKYSDVSNIVVARAEEIVANVIETIEYAGLRETDLPGGIVCIGGASNLNGLLELLTSKSNLPVRRGSLPPYIRLEGAIPAANSLQLACIMYEGAELNDAECLSMPQREGIPVTGTPNTPADNTLTDHVTPEKPETPSHRKSWFGKIKKGLTDYFGSDPEADNDEMI